jgi:hypothetical protein
VQTEIGEGDEETAQITRVFNKVKEIKERRAKE